MADKILRATAAGSQIRAFVADTKELVTEAHKKHHTYPVTTAALGRTMAAALMMGTDLKNDGEITTN